MTTISSQNNLIPDDMFSEYVKLSRRYLMRKLTKQMQVMWLYEEGIIGIIHWCLLIPTDIKFMEERIELLKHFFSFNPEVQ